MTYSDFQRKNWGASRTGMAPAAGCQRISPQLQLHHCRATFARFGQLSLPSRGHLISRPRPFADRKGLRGLCWRTWAVNEHGRGRPSSPSALRFSRPDELSFFPPLVVRAVALHVCDGLRLAPLPGFPIAPVHRRGWFGWRGADRSPPLQRRCGSLAFQLPSRFFFCGAFC
jgi:hypothetical protein